MAEGRKSAKKAPATAGTPKPQPKKGDPAVQIQRGRKITELRARRPRPVAWKDIAAEIGLSIKQCQTIGREYVEQGWDQVEQSALTIIDHTIDTFAAVQLEAWEQYQTAERPSDRIGALKVVMKAADERLQTMILAGRVPRALATPQIHLQVRTVFSIVGRVLDEQKVPDPVVMAMIDEVRQVMPELFPPDVDGGQLNAA